MDRWCAMPVLARQKARRMQVSEINELGKSEARELLTRCCGSKNWVEAMIARRPFESQAQLLQAADQVWSDLSDDDWREAFSHHPQIGDIDGLRKKFASTANWASGEQSGVQGAAE